ncbi:MAG: hypothetical protein ACRDPY_09665 [Streptosporangiaceae bacterium]
MSTPDDLPTPEEIDRFMRATVRADLMIDETVSMLEDRITDLEEIVCARWPRSILVGRLLRRKIRASISGVPGRTFADRRASAISFEMAARERRPGGRP